MNRKFTLIIILQALLIIILFWVLVFYGKDEYASYKQAEDEVIEGPTLVKDGVGANAGISMVTLPIATQHNSGIKTSPLQATNHNSTLEAFGTVISLYGLIELRSKYAAALGELGVMRANASNNLSEYQRLKTLNADDKNVSDASLASAASKTKGDLALMGASEANMNNLRDAMRSQWGEVLTNIAIQKPSNMPLLDNSTMLIQLALPLEAQEPKPNSQIQLINNVTNDASLTATFLSLAPSADSTLAGKTYFYTASSNTLRVGLRLRALISSNASNNTALNHSKPASGVIVPNSAVVWYGGKAWVYIKLNSASTSFIRKPVNTEIETSTEAGQGWFNPNNSATELAANNEVVTSGAQLLLSEELKSQIKNENEN